MTFITTGWFIRYRESIGGIEIWRVRNRWVVAVEEPTTRTRKFLKVLDSGYEAREFAKAEAVRRRLS